MLTCPVDPLVPSVVVGLTTRSVRSRDGSISTCPVAVAPPYDALTCASVVAATVPAVVGTWANVDPAGTTTVAGTGNAGESLARATVAPPDGAAEDKETSTVKGSALATTPGKT